MASRAQFGQNPEDTEKEMEEMKTKLDTLTSVPKKKYPFPMTSNQEIGWDNDEVRFVHLFCRNSTTSNPSILTIRRHVLKQNMLLTMLP